MKATQAALFSTHSVNPLTSKPAFGPPKGLINKFISSGLPPWAAWSSKLNRHAFYRMSGVAERSFLPKPAHEMDAIWMNERVRTRVRTSPANRYVFRQHQYPYVKTGIHFSDTLNHWVQLPMVQSAMLQIEKDGGLDNFILKKSGRDLQSTYGERLRRHLLVRQKEIKKNFVLEKHATALADAIHTEIAAVRGKEAVENILVKYGVSKQAFYSSVALEISRGKSVTLHD